MPARTLRHAPPRSRTSRTRAAAAAAALGLAATLAARAGAEATDPGSGTEAAAGEDGAAWEHELELVERLGVDWQHEWLRFELPAGLGPCPAERLSLEGPQGRVAVQRSAPGPGAAGGGSVAFVADLGSLERHRYRLRCHETPALPAPATDLRLQRRAGQAVVTTRRFGAKLLLGERRLAEPIAAARAPAPIAALRLDDGESWFGGSRLFGNAAVVAWASRIREAGPVFVEVETRYELAGGGALLVRSHLAAGDGSLLIDVEGSDVRSPQGVDLLLGPGLPPLSHRVAVEWGPARRLPDGRSAERGSWIGVPLASLAPGTLVTSLTPWHDLWDDRTQTSIRLQMRGRERELRITRRRAGDWVAPAPLGTFGSFGREDHLPLRREEAGPTLRIEAGRGDRHLAVGLHAERDADDFPYLARFRPVRHGALGRRLDVVKDYDLDWKQAVAHPHLYLDAEELSIARQRRVDAWKIDRHVQRLRGAGIGKSVHALSLGVGAFLMTGDEWVAQETRLVERLRWYLSRLGQLDTMRVTSPVAALYDSLMGTGLVEPQERDLLRARFAYLAYQLAAPETWSVERGYASGNLNMSVSSVMMLGIAACTIPDHPEARDWAERAAALLDRLLDTKVGPAGEWPESAAHYAHVAATPMLAFTIAAQRAGFADFVDDPRMQRLMLYLAKQLTPPDPRHRDRDEDGQALGATVPIGRGLAGETIGSHGAFARAARHVAPELSRHLQWLWLRTGQPTRLYNEHLGGWEHVYMDPRLAAERPPWEFDLFPRNGVLMRHGIGSDDEWWLYLVNEQRYTLGSENGTLPMIFARGVPISARFVASYPDREELLLSRPLLARRRGTPEEREACFAHDARLRRLVAASALPRQQYARGEYTIDGCYAKAMAPPERASYSHMRTLPEWPPVLREARLEAGGRWTRQLQFVRADAPDGASYLVLRDRMSGGEPTMWQIWTVSELIETAERAAEPARLLRKAPGERVRDFRRLEQSDRYTALGSFGVDVEIYVAEPGDTPRHTLRHGLTHAYGTLNGYTEYQDLLHLQRPDDGDYFVALFPRDRDGEVPRFTTLAQGKVLRVSGDFGTDLAFLWPEPTRAEAGDARFRGTAGTVQDRRSGLVLSLPAPGSIAHRGIELASERGAELRLDGSDALTIAFPLPRDEAGEATFRVPGRWRLAEGQPGVRLVEQEDGALLVLAAASVERVRLVRRAAPSGGTER